MSLVLTSTYPTPLKNLERASIRFSQDVPADLGADGFGYEVSQPMLVGAEIVENNGGINSAKPRNTPL